MVEIPRDEIWTFPRLDRGDFILELGNKKNTTGVYREFYEAKGMDYECVDWNRLDGAHEIDMGADLPNPYWDWAPKIVTNFGFTEHVYTDQVQCWYNINHWLRTGGSYLCFVMPYPGQWEHHGVYQPQPEWYEEYAKENGFEMNAFMVNKDRRRWTICGQMQRKVLQDDSDFHFPEGMMHITPPNQRVNKDERACGVTP